MTRIRDPRERILERVTKEDRGYTSPCWISDRATNQFGHTKIAVGRQTLYTHRLAYEVFVGPIPEGLNLDHLCRQPACCNPLHVEPVTQQVNVLRGDSPMAVQARATHCIRGHAFTPQNTTISGGKRCCRECNRSRCRERYAARRAAAAA